MANPGCFDMMETIFVGQTIETGLILPKIFFAPQNEPHTAKRSFSCILTNLCRKLTKDITGLKIDYIRKKLRINQKVIFFSTSLKRDESWGFFWFDGNKFFLSNQWNGTNFTENSFAPQNKPHTAKLSFSFVLKHFLLGNWQITSF